MAETKLDRGDVRAIQRGLRMANPPDPAKLAQERAHLTELEKVGPLKRARGYLRLIGPGYMQSAMTLGGGTASASLFAGAIFGYQLLWVAPFAMLLGVIMLSAVAHQTLSTGLRPFQAMAHFAGRPFAIGWAVGAVLSSIIWQFPQYTLASAALVDMGEVASSEFGLSFLSGLPAMGVALGVLAIAVGLSFLYGRSARLIRWYERILKYMVWSIVLCFGLVVWRTGISDWGGLFRGFVPNLPEEKNGIAATTIILSGLSAAVGINMLFLYPYSLLARGWEREHRRMARWDLGLGMLLPYSLATSLMVIATANTLHLDPSFENVTRIQPVDAAQSLATTIGPTLGRIVFNFGILGMALSSITLQMLTAGFVCMELFGWEVGSWRYRLATLLPAPGVLGPLFWGKIAVWVAIPTNIACGLMLPIAYFGFIRLQKSKPYLGADRPSMRPGSPGWFWWLAMVATTVFLSGFLLWYVQQNGGAYVDRLVELTGGGTR